MKEKREERITSFAALTAAFILLSSSLPLPHASAVEGHTFAYAIGTPTTDDLFRALELSCENDGSAVLVGHTAGLGAGLIDALFLKVDADGTIAWQKTIGGANNDTPRDIVRTCSLDGGYLIVGQSTTGSSGSNDMWMIKVDNDGDPIWQRTLGKSGADVAHSVDFTGDGFVMAGYTTNSGDKDYAIAKYSTAGALLWQKSYPSLGGDDVIRTIKSLSSGNLLVGGFSHSQGPAGDVMLLMLDSSGHILWQRNYGGSEFEEVCCIIEVNDGIIFMEQSNSFSTSSAGWIVKIDFNGNVLSQVTLNGPSFEEFSSAQLMPDGSFWIAGEDTDGAPEDFLVAHYDANLNLLLQKRQGGDGIDEAESIVVAPDGRIYVAGHTMSSFSHGGDDILLMALNDEAELTNCNANMMTTHNVTATGVEGISNLQTGVTSAGESAATMLSKSVPLTTATQSLVPTVICQPTPVDGLPSPNQPPVAAADSYQVDEGQILTVNAAAGVLANDTDAELSTLTASLVSTTSNGALTLNPDGSFTYNPNPGFDLTDSFSYTASDGQLNSSPATVTITVNPVAPPPPETAPQAEPDIYDTKGRKKMTIPATYGVLANDSDDDPMTAVLVSQPSYGTLVLRPNGSFTYTLNATNPPTTDTFTYYATDGTLNSEVTTVTILL